MVSAGTAEALSATSQRVASLTVVAKDNNTGRAYLGGSGVDSTVNRGLQAGDVLVHTPFSSWLDLKDVYIDVDVNGEGIDFYAVKA